MQWTERAEAEQGSKGAWHSGSFSSFTGSGALKLGIIRGGCPSVVQQFTAQVDVYKPKEWLRATVKCASYIWLSDCILLFMENHIIDIAHQIIPNSLNRNPSASHS
ncbi:hypothetical protein KQX54_002952 [Cotesia glomerata]|uniref:Uncharacterized protein n=1 Tax=Cotesia glomerata TaxID=32391 RepID=A0AAV7J4D7_COTGL|nr:hypothetical protein KQX54_002952 [Cotesia glomerata]